MTLEPDQDRWVSGLKAADAQTSQWRVSCRNHGNLSLASSAAFRRHSRHEVTVTEEAEPLDIWAAIKTGHVREKMAIFGSDGGGAWGGPGPCRVRKSKGKWEEEEGGAKRQRSTGVAMVAEGEEPRPSVAAMVASLEQRFRQQRRPKAPPLTPLRAPPSEPDGVRVSAMVTRLESDPPRSRRTAGRVLLATAPRSSSPGPPQRATPPPVGSARPAAGRTPPDPPSQAAAAEPPPGLLFGTPAPPRALPGPAPGPPPSPEGGASMCAFLEARRRLQRLLEPRPFLTLLPPHLLVRVLALLPTRSLAALSCCCRYFRLVIAAYDVRPADALWVRDPAYSRDPCKQCRRRCGRGDVSLCRWHHKPFCQALPFGPGFWMCCRRARRDAPGCNVGLHDNRWVPAFHSRWSQEE